MVKKKYVIIILLLGIISIYFNYINLIPENYFEKQIEYLVNDVDNEYSINVSTRSYAKIDNLNIIHFKSDERVGYAIFEEKLLSRPRVKTIAIDNNLVYSFLAKSYKSTYFIILGENPNNIINYIKILNNNETSNISVDSGSTFIYYIKLDTENINVEYYNKENREISNSLKVNTGIPIKSIYIKN